MLVVGYHGRPIAHDMCMLQNVVEERLGYMPHPIFHGYFGENPVLRRLIDDLGFLAGEGPEIEAAIARGEHIFTTPGGTREGCRSVRHRYRVNWGRRTGYLRLALEHGLPIVPVATHGTDDAFIGLNDGYTWGKRLGVPKGLPAWIGFGLVGMWPLAIPFPVKFRQRVGPPIERSELGVDDPTDRDALLRAHAVVTGRIQGMLDELRSGG
jgi:hypothetical protein